jgi:hypothetical protein
LNAPLPSVVAPVTVSPLKPIVTVAELLNPVPLRVTEVPGCPCVGLMLRDPSAKTGIAWSPTRIKQAARSPKPPAKAETGRDPALKRPF